MRVAGVDGTKNGWVAVVLNEGRVEGTILLPEIETRFAELGDVSLIAVDVPIGFGPREADMLARQRIGGSTVFPIPSREAFEGKFGPGRGITAQAFNLGNRIRHMTELARTDSRLREVHPELCFWAMNGEQRLRCRKKSAGGAFERIALLREHGITLDLKTLGEAALVPLDDVLDAAACAWTAARTARADGTAVSLPDPPQPIEGLSVAIWY